MKPSVALSIETDKSAGVLGLSTLVGCIPSTLKAGEFGERIEFKAGRSFVSWANDSSVARAIKMNAPIFLTRFSTLNKNVLYVINNFVIMVFYRPVIVKMIWSCIGKIVQDRCHICAQIDILNSCDAT